jgi:retron-type reverse transcriptase
MKVLERIVEKCIRAMINIGEMQFGFLPGRGTTDAIFILRQLQEKYIAKNRNIFFAFVDLEKAFDRVPCEVLLWAMRRTGVEEWLVSVVQLMYKDASSKVRVGNEYSEPINVKVWVHQGSVPSPLLFIIVLEALSREFRTRCPWELLYPDDLVIIADNVQELTTRLKAWKDHMETKGLRVNMKKT